ncbi:MAG: hypothetical protein E7351_03490 [Clostridiales bacterium]|nr:hypothetical protein [Clostridiales bacterium]
MKWIKKYWYKILNIALIVFVLIYSITVAFKKVHEYKMYEEQEIEIEMYTIWHIETFEGGGKARINYLKSIARSIEKSNAGVLFVIRAIDADKLASELTFDTPDIISFGYGVGKTILPILKSQDTAYDIRDELIESGSFNRNLYALPYIMSGYAMFTHSAESTEFHCGQTNFTKPEIIYNTLNLSPIETEAQYDAYKDFVYNKNVKLLGTGRDLYRVNNLNNIGRANAQITPIDTYTDLIQYIGTTKNDSITKKYLNAIFSMENQQALVDYSLFSSLYIKIYQNGIYSDMEDAIMSASIPRVFE